MFSVYKMELFKALGLCLVAAVLAVVLSDYKKEYALIISVACACAIFFGAIKSLINPISEIVALIKNAGVQSSYFGVALKALAMGYITQFVADTCRDFGQSSIAAKAEFAGKAAIFIISVPLLSTLLGVITALLG